VKSDDGHVIGTLFGPQAIGLLLLAPDGRMLASLCDGREALPDGATREFAAFSGNYRVDVDAVVIQVDASSIPAMLNTEQIRKVVRLESNRMTIHPSRILLNGVPAQQELVWERVA